MNENADSENEVVKSQTYAGDLNAFSNVVSALQQLDHDARIRVLRTVATFFNLDLGFGNRPQNRSVSHNFDSSGQTPVATFSEDRAPSPKDFLRDKKPMTDVERVACLAYYLTHYRDTPHFKTIDLSSLNTEAAQVKFSNAAQAVDNAAKTGLLVPAQKGMKQLSALGEEYVGALPDRSAAKDAIAHGRPKRKAKRRPPNAGVDSPAADE